MGLLLLLAVGVLAFHGVTVAACFTGYHHWLLVAALKQVEASCCLLQVARPLWPLLVVVAA